MSDHNPVIDKESLTEDPFAFRPMSEEDYHYFGLEVDE